MNITLTSEPKNLMFSDLEIGETFVQKGRDTVFMKVQVVIDGDISDSDIGYLNLSTGFVKVDESPDFPVLEVDFEEPIKARALV